MMNDRLGEAESFQGFSARTNFRPFSLAVVTFEAYAPALGVSWLSHSCTIAKMPSAPFFSCLSNKNLFFTLIWHVE